MTPRTPRRSWIRARYSLTQAISGVVGQAAALLEVEHRQQVAADRSGGVDEVIGLGGGVAGLHARPREVIGTDVQALGLGARAVRGVRVVHEVDVIGCLEVGEILAGLGDGDSSRSAPANG